MGDDERPRLAVRVTKDAERQIRGGHPWIYDESIASVKPEGAAGDLAVVFDGRRRFLAIGLYDPASPIRIKVLHAGDPTPVDRSFWAGRLDAAIAVRSDLAASADTTGYRLVHGENDGLPGFVLDRYGDHLVAKLYSAAWFPHLSTVVELVADRLAPASLTLRLARNVQRGDTGGRADGDPQLGAPPAGPVLFREHGLAFEADVVRGQKTGYFLDQRENRRLVGELSHGRRVLDVFSCAGGFSVHAAAGGARAVHSVDISPSAIDSARRNMAHNAALPAIAACRHDTTTGDAMEVMARLALDGARFDVVVVDPPSFASNKSQVSGALRSYGRLTELAVALLEPGGTLVQASCSSRVTPEDFEATVVHAADAAGVRLTDVTRTGQPVDHPIGFPQGGYLKALFATVR
jgi:23S rRNA (cytosine1962-C5)-methyltransferase